jgi:hypothetical protein
MIFDVPGLVEYITRFILSTKQETYAMNHKPLRHTIYTK